MKTLGLGKEERLRHRSLVDGLFRNGTTIYEYPLRLTWRALGDEALTAGFRDRVPPRIGRLQMLITVPKKKLRHAVDRVRMRRLIREAYRLNRIPLRQRAEEAGVRTVQMAFIYVHPAKMDYAAIEKKMRRLLDKINLTDTPPQVEDKDIRSM